MCTLTSKTIMIHDWCCPSISEGQTINILAHITWAPESTVVWHTLHGLQWNVIYRVEKELRGMHSHYPEALFASTYFHIGCKTSSITPAAPSKGLRYFSIIPYRYSVTGTLLEFSCFFTQNNVHQGPCLKVWSQDQSHPFKFKIPANIFLCRTLMD